MGKRKAPTGEKVNEEATKNAQDIKEVKMFSQAPMAKRRISESQKSPTKKNNDVKKERLASPSDSEPEVEEFEYNDQTEQDETKTDGNQLAYEPDQMRLFVESFADFLSFRQAQSSTVQNMEKLVAEWAETRPEDAIDVGLFCVDYRKYLKNAMRVKNFQLNDASNVLVTYLSSEKSLNDFTSLPTKPPTRIQAYLKRKSIPHTLVEMANAYKMMREDESEVTKEVNEDIRLASLEYIPRLQEFIDSHPNLTEIQRRHLTATINRLQKQLSGSKDAQKTPKKKAGKKEPETAYSLFCRSKSDKYRDLSEEDRNKKLQKKFAKLSPAELELLESLAINS